MTSRRGWCALLTAGLWLTGTPLAAQSQLFDQVDRPLVADDGTAFVVTTGIVRVPELRAAGDTVTIELAVVRIRRGEVPSHGAHLFLAGGPGESGVNLAMGLAQRGGAVWADLLKGDLIGIDQRGTGKSKPNLSSAARYNLPLDRAGSAEAWLPIMAGVSRAVAAEFTARGIRLTAYNTTESADDVDAVRRALGYNRLTLWGRSYGTHLALATLRRHPESVERVILVSPEGPDHTWKMPSLVDSVLLRISARAGRPELVAQMRQVFGRLRDSAVTVAVNHPATGTPQKVTIGAFDIQWLTALALGDPRALGTVPSAFAEMAQGRWERMATLALIFRGRLGVESAMKQIMDLSSGATAARRARIAGEGSTALLGNAINFPGMYLAEAWGSPDLGDAFRQPVRSAVPTLILVGDLDPRTPVENAREITATLSRGQVVVLENATHQFDLFGSAPIREVLGRFVNGAEVREERLVLPAIPFAP